MKAASHSFSFSAVALSVGTAALAEALPTGASPQALVWQELLFAGALTALSAGAGQLLPRLSQAPQTAVAVLLQLWLAAELVQTAWRALALCRQEFSSLALLGFLPLLLWAGWRRAPEDWTAPAQVLWWLAALGGVVCLAGLGGQMGWPRLLAWEQAPKGPFTVPVYAEYAAWPLLCRSAGPRGATLPLLTGALQTGVALALVLVFGRDYPARELLRAWSVGVFSRLDAALLLLWLICALFRMGLLTTALRALGGSGLRKEKL